MATVRFSDDLRLSILGNAEKLFDKRIHDARHIGLKWPKIVADDYVLTVNNLLAGVPQLVRDSFIDYGKAFEIKEFIRKQEQPVEVAITSGFIKIPLPYVENENVAQQLGFIKYTRGYDKTLRVVLDGDSPKWADLCAKAIARNEGIQNILEEKDKFKANVRVIINSYATLSPALKAWPPLWDLVPQEKQERHKEIVERKRTAVEDVVSGMNLDQMTATTVASKLRR